MHPSDVESWLAKRPFEPIVITLTTGERIAIKHPDAVYRGTYAYHVVYLKNGRYHGAADISLNHIVKIERLNGETADVENGYIGDSP